jgi:hypothetical protein
MQHLKSTLATYVSKRQTKLLEHMLATYVYNHCNMCNITIYFYNIYIKYLQHTFETSKTIETYSCNMCCEWCSPDRQRAGGACRQRAGGSGCTLRKEGIGRMSGGEAVAARLGEGTNALCLARSAAERRDSEAAAHHAWQGQCLSGAPRRRPRATPWKASCCVLGGSRRTDKNDRKRNEWIRISG